MKCNDAGQGAPGCTGTADPEFTMRFDSIGEQIHWCSVCGERARAMEEAINQAYKDDPGFAERFRKAIDDAEGTKH